MTGRIDAATIEAEAVRWVMRLDREGETPDLLAEIDRWAETDPRHRGALLQAEAAWATIDRPDDVVSAAATDIHAIPTSLPTGWGRRAMLAGIGSALAASVILYVALPGGRRYETAVGEVRRIPLADRSTIAINTASRIDVAYASDRRRVTIEHGEAWFQVAKDRTRPFIVSAGPVRVEAVGTAFSVRRRTGGADVLVTEGVVRVWAGDRREPARSLEAGTAAFVTDSGAVHATAGAAPAIERRLAWRAGHLDLAGETLGEASMEFNRHNAMSISVAPALAGKRLYGRFRLDDPEGFARTAAVSLGASAWKKDGTMVIGPRGSRSTGGL